MLQSVFSRLRAWRTRDFTPAPGLALPFSVSDQKKNKKRKKNSFCRCLFLLSVWLSVAHTKLPRHFVLWLKKPSDVQIQSGKTCSPCPKLPGERRLPTCCSARCPETTRSRPKSLQFSYTAACYVAKTFFILISAIKARYATSKDATTPLSTSGC